MTDFDPGTVELATKIFQLARLGQTQELAAHIDAGVPVNLTNDRGDSLLMLASYHGHLQTTDTLLGRGADPNVCNDRGQTPLAGAVFKGDVDIIVALLKHGADPGAGSPSAIATAAMFGREDLLDLLG